MKRPMVEVKEDHEHIDRIHSVEWPPMSFDTFMRMSLNHIRESIGEPIIVLTGSRRNEPITR